MINTFADWEEQLRQARGEDDAAKISFSARLWAADYLVPGKPGKGLILLVAQTEEFFLPAYTSEGEFARCQAARERRAVLPFTALHCIIADDSRLHGIVINPFGAALVLRRTELAAIERVVTGMTRTHAEQTTISHPRFLTAWRFAEYGQHE